MGLDPGDGLGGHHALGLGHVGEHHLRRAVADGVNPGDVGAEVVVDGNGAAFGQGDPGVLQAVTLGARGEPDSREETIRLQDLGGTSLGGTDGDPYPAARVLD